MWHARVCKTVPSSLPILPTEESSKDDAAADKDSEKLTADKLKKKVDSIRYIKVLQDKRGEPSERLMSE